MSTIESRLARLERKSMEQDLAILGVVGLKSQIHRINELVKSCELPALKARTDKLQRDVGRLHDMLKAGR